MCITTVRNHSVCLFHLSFFFSFFPAEKVSRKMCCERNKIRDTVRQRLKDSSLEMMWEIRRACIKQPYQYARLADDKMRVHIMKWKLRRSRAQQNHSTFKTTMKSKSNTESSEQNKISEQRQIKVTFFIMSGVCSYKINYCANDFWYFFLSISPVIMIIITQLLLLVFCQLAVYRLAFIIHLYSGQIEPRFFIEFIPNSVAEYGK